jgi:hypothetical protein
MAGMCHKECVGQDTSGLSHSEELEKGQVISLSQGETSAVQPAHEPDLSSLGATRLLQALWGSLTGAGSVFAAAGTQVRRSG